MIVQGVARVEMEKNGGWNHRRIGFTQIQLELTIFAFQSTMWNLLWKGDVWMINDMMERGAGE